MSRTTNTEDPFPEEEKNSRLENIAQEDSPLESRQSVYGFQTPAGSIPSSKSPSNGVAESQFVTESCSRSAKASSRAPGVSTPARSEAGPPAPMVGAGILFPSVSALGAPKLIQMNNLDSNATPNEELCFNSMDSCPPANGSETQARGDGQTSQDNWWDDFSSDPRDSIPADRVSTTEDPWWKDFTDDYFHPAEKTVNVPVGPKPTDYSYMLTPADTIDYDQFCKHDEQINYSMAEVFDLTFVPGYPTDGSAPSGTFPKLVLDDDIMQCLFLVNDPGEPDEDTTTRPLIAWIYRAIEMRGLGVGQELAAYMRQASNIATTSLFVSAKEALRAHRNGVNVILYLMRCNHLDVGFFMGLLRSSHAHAKRTFSTPPVRQYAAPAPLGPEHHVRVLYYRGYARVPKPLLYTPSSFLRWIKGESSYIYEHTRGLVPVVNQVTNGLMSGRFAGSIHETQRLFQAATVGTAMWSELTGTTVVVSAADRCFRVGPIIVRNLEELDKLSSFFLPKHKKGFQYLYDFFAGRSVDQTRLESVIAKALPEKVWDKALCCLAIREGGQFSKDAATALNDPITQDVGRRLGEGAAEGIHAGFTSALPSLLSSVTQISSAAISTLTPSFWNGVGKQTGRGLISSVPSTFFRHAGYDAMQGAIEAASQTIRESDGLWQQVLNAALGIAAMAAAESYTSFYLALLQTLNGDPIARSLAIAMFEELKTSPLRQGDEEENTWMGQIAGLGFFSAIRTFFGEVYEALIPSFLDVCRHIKFAGLKEGATKVAQWLSECVAELGRRIQACIDQRSLNPLFGVDAVRWVRHSRGVLEFKDIITAVPVNLKTLQELVQKDEIPESFRVHMCPNDFLEAVEAHISDGKKLQSLVSPAMKNSFSSIMARLNALKAETMANINRYAQRPAPFCVLFWGPPGTGKTMVAQAYARSVAAKEGRDDNSVYSYQSGANFQTGLGAHTTCVCMDDPDAVLLKPNGENHCEFLQRLVNNNPFPVEAADVSEKGKVICRPTDVVVTSNTDNLGAALAMTAPDAVWRRIHLWIRPTVKEEFRVHGQDRLDTTKSFTMTNSCTWTISEFVEADGRSLVTRVVLRDVSYKEAMRFVFARRAEYLDRQRSLAATASDKCGECHMPNQGCVCEEVQREGFGEVLAYFKTPDRMSEYLKSLTQYFTLSSGVGTLLGVSASYMVISRIMSTLSLTTQGLLAGTPPDGWHRASQTNAPIMPADNPCTWSFEKMREHVALMAVQIIGSPYGGSDMSGMIYRNGWVLFPTHAFGKPGVLDLKYRDATYKIRSEHCHKYFNAELSLTYVAALSGVNGIHKYVQLSACGARSLGDGYLIGPRTRHCGRADNSKQWGFPAWQYANVTEAGDCGHVLGALGPGGYPRIFGMHIFAVPNEWSKAVEIAQDLIDGVILQNSPERVLAEGCFSANLTQSAPLEHFPPKSEIWVSHTFWQNNAICWGMRAVAGRTVKTGFRKTSFHDEVKAFAEEKQIFHDYAPPQFKGGMVNDVYTSPYTHALKESNTSDTTYLDCVDYLVKRLAGHWGDFLTEDEALRGVPGEFNSINLRSSMGPPHGGPKTRHITPDRTHMSPELRSTLDEIESILAQGKVPRVMAEAVLKDEILKVGKPARVFCMVAAAFNIACKRRFAILKRAMRSSFGASECCVGIDMGSRCCEDIVRILQSRKYIYSMDCSRMDKMWTPQCWDAVAEVIRRVTAISAGEKAGFEAWALVMAMKEAIICIKGDLFTAFWNISGNDITVELNSILLSLMLEKTRRHYGIEFVTLTYGDDNINVSADPLPADFFETFTRITGFQVTDANKNTTPQAEALTEVSFLKRTFRYDEEYQCWCAPLSESSIVKMLLFRGRSSLSPPEHEDQLVDAANRYAILLGRRRYNEWRALLSTLTTRPLLHFDDAMKDYCEGDFSDWCAREIVHDGTPSFTPTPVEYQGKTNSMEHSSINALTNESVPLQQVPEHEPAVMTESHVEGDSTKVVVPADTLVSSSASTFTSFQEPPVFDLGQFPERWARIGRTDVASTDIAGTSVYDINITQALIGNFALAFKLRNFAYWRGDIELMGVWDVPGNASGAYVAVAYPASPGVYMYGAHAHSCMSYERSVLLPVSSSVDFVIECPFFSDADAEPRPIQNAWVFKLFCLSPILTAQASGVSQGSLTLYARLKPGYKLMTPTWEGKNGSAKRIIRRGRELQQSKVISRTANTVADISEKLTKVPLIGGVASLVNNVASSTALVADWLGFSRKNEQGHTQIVAQRSVTNVALTDGLDSADVAGFSVTNSIDMDPGILGGENIDEMSFESMSNRWIAVSSFDWSADKVALARLATIHISPGFYKPVQSGVAIPTGAGYCGLPFEYWRADVEYCVVIPTSALHRGSLEVLYYPQATGPQSGMWEVTNQGMSAIMDVSSATVYNIKVGFASNAPMLPLQYFTGSEPIVPIGSCNGSLQFRVVNPLVSQNPVDSVKVWVFARFKNVQLAVPRSLLRSYDGENSVVNQWELGVMLEGSAPGDEDAGEAMDIELVPGSGVPYPVHSVVAGENISSLRALAQRPTRLMHPKDSDPCIIGYGGRTRSGGGPAQVVTTAMLALAPFVLSAASERVKFIGTNQEYVGACAVVGSLGTVGAPWSSQTYPAMPMTYTGPQRGAEFHIPYYFPRRGRVMKPCDLDGADPANASTDRCILLSRTSSNAYEIYYSLGDDIRVGPYRGMPIVTFLSSARAYKAFCSAQAT